MHLSIEVLLTFQNSSVQSKLVCAGTEWNKAGSNLLGYMKKSLQYSLAHRQQFGEYRKV